MSKLAEVKKSPLARCSSFSSLKWSGSTPDFLVSPSMFKRRSRITLNKEEIIPPPEEEQAMKMRLNKLTTKMTQEAGNEVEIIVEATNEIIEEIGVTIAEEDPKIGNFF